MLSRAYITVCYSWYIMVISRAYSAIFWQVECGAFLHEKGIQAETVYQSLNPDFIYRPTQLSVHNTSATNRSPYPNPKIQI